MDYKTQLHATIRLVTEQKESITAELAKLEDEFANVKLNPYGITSIDFAKRQEMSTDVLKMEGTLMGLTLALETYDRAMEDATTE
jgi:hypothetical protein